MSARAMDVTDAAVERLALYAEARGEIEEALTLRALVEQRRDLLAALQEVARVRGSTGGPAARAYHDHALKHGWHSTPAWAEGRAAVGWGRREGGRRSSTLQTPRADVWAAGQRTAAAADIFPKHARMGARSIEGVCEYA